MSNYPPHETLTPHPSPPDPRDVAMRHAITVMLDSTRHMACEKDRQPLRDAAKGLERVLGDQKP